MEFFDIPQSIQTTGKLGNIDLKGLEEGARIGIEQGKEKCY